MQTRCPHCNSPVELSDEDLSADISCPACGSGFNLARDTQTHCDDSSRTRTVGHFELLECVGQGAFGTVWKARDTELDRIVALKIPRRDVLSGEEAERFLREARTTAQLKHPHIATIHEIGRDDGRVYVATDFIDGADLDEWASVHRLSARESVELCLKIADALHHAHQSGIIHRDLKPQNIMLSMRGEPHITDFGLAKRDAGEVTMTIEGQILGTPAFMSPEQARGQGHHADRRSDVYSLGVILFWLLTGELPFRGKLRMLIVQILTEDPPALRKLDSRVPRDLETICLKCLEKDAERRYPTAAELADDLRRWRTGHPIHARPIGRLERACRWWRRNPAVASLSVAVLTVLLAGVAVSSFFAWEATLRARDAVAQQQRADINADAAREKATEAEREKQRADDEAHRARAHLHVAQMNLARRDWEQVNLDELQQRLETTCPMNQGNDDLRGFEWYYWDWLCNRSHRLQFHADSKGISSLAFSPDEQRLATAGEDGVVSIWDLPNGKEAFHFPAHTDVVRGIVFNADGSQLATVSDDRTLRLWDAHSYKELHNLNGQRCAAFSPDNQWIVSADQNTSVCVYEVQTGLLARPFEPSHDEPVTSVAFLPSGHKFVTASNDRTLAIWDVSRRSEVLTLKGHEDSISAVAVSLDGEWVASGGHDKTARFWNLAKIEQAVGPVPAVGAPDWTASDGHVVMLEHPDAVTHVAFRPGSNHVVTACQDRAIRIWDVTNETESLTLKGHRGAVRCAAFSPHGKWLATADEFGVVKLWDPAKGQRPIELRGSTDDVDSNNLGHESWINGLCFSADGRRLAAASENGIVALWELFDSLEGHSTRRFGRCRDTGWIELDQSSTQPSVSIGKPLLSIALSPDGTRLAWSEDKSLYVWDDTERTGPRKLHECDSLIRSVAFFPDGANLATAHADGSVRRRDFSRGETCPAILGRGGEELACLAVSPDGQSLAFGGYQGGVKIWDRVRNERTVPVKHTFVNAVAFSPDSKWLASAGSDREFHLWQSTTGDERSFRGHMNQIYGISFHPDGKRLASASADGTVKIWDVSTAQEVLTLSVATPVSCVAFSPNRKHQRLAAACSDGRILVWDVGERPAK